MHSALLLLSLFGSAVGLERPDVEFKIFQFPADRIPRIDGNADDWAIVPDSYAIGSDQLKETVTGIGDKRDPANLDVKVKVGWVNGQNHLYFLYEAFDNYWDFARPDLHNDIFEIVVDGDLSGGPLIRQMHPNEKLRGKLDTHFLFHGVHAQNYHIFTPAEGKDWAMVWGSQPWIKDLPYANAASQYKFKHGESGKLVLEFFITPFDYAPPDRARAVPSKLQEDKVIGLSWAILDYDVRRCVGPRRIPPDADREESPQTDRSRLEFQSREPRRSDGRVPRSVLRRDHFLALGIRRRSHLDRTAPRAPL
jgi:hypothetical protein